MTVNLTSGPKCPACERGHLVPFTRDEEFDYDLGEETIKVVAKDVPVERCDTCGMIASGSAAAKVRHEAICRAVGLLTPSEIKALREQFGWSQQHLADLTDFGVATVSRWERGRLLQNRSANKVLQAIRDCPPFREYLERWCLPKAREPMTVSETTEMAEVLQRVKSWLPPMRLALARHLLGTLDASVVEGAPQPPRGPSAAEVTAMFQTHKPAPDDATVKQWLEEYRLEKYGQ